MENNTTHHLRQIVNAEFASLQIVLSRFDASVTAVSDGPNTSILEEGGSESIVAVISPEEHPHAGILKIQATAGQLARWSITSWALPGMDSKSILRPASWQTGKIPFFIDMTDEYRAALVNLFPDLFPARRSVAASVEKKAEVIVTQVVAVLAPQAPAWDVVKAHAAGRQFNAHRDRVRREDHSRKVADHGHNRRMHVGLAQAEKAAAAAPVVAKVKGERLERLIAPETVKPRKNQTGRDRRFGARDLDTEIVDVLQEVAATTKPVHIPTSSSEARVLGGTDLKQGLSFDFPGLK